MIVNKKTKIFQIRSDRPNSNWMGADWFLVNDNYALAQKIDELYPNFDFVLDNNGNLIDIVEIPKSKEELDKERVAEIDAELDAIDSQGVTRHLENQIEASGTYDTIYESTRKLIDRKNELREERKALIGGNANAENNVNE